MTFAVTDNLALLSAAPGGLKALRQLFRDLAISGRLVSQSESDEPAAAVLSATAAMRSSPQAKRASSAEGRQLAEGLPRGWAATIVGEVLICRDGERVPVSQADREARAKVYDYYGASGVIDKIDGFLFDKPLLLVGEDGANLVNRSTPIAFIARGKYWVNNHAHVLDGLGEDLLRYMALFFNAIDLKPYVTGTAQPKLNQSKLNAIPVALPPRDEQRRIVAKVDELMALCDRLEARQQDAEAAHARLVRALLESLAQARDADEFRACWERLEGQFTELMASDVAVEALQATLVLLAVTGRLVSQSPKDESGLVLLKRLAAAKQIATKDGRKQKEISAFDLPAPPFDAPTGWAWAHMDQVLAISGGVTLGRKLSGRAMRTAPYLRVANVQRGRLDLTEVKEIEVPSDEIEKYQLEAGDLLITEGGDWDKVGRTAVWADELPLCLHQNHVFRARRCSDELDLRWAELYLNSPVARDYFAGASKQTTNLASINMTQLRSCALPIPPLAEQRRIVAKVSELLTLCDRLKARIAAARDKHAQLAEALVVEAVAT